MSMLIRGATNGNLFSNSTWYYNHATQTFKPGPTLLEGRYRHTAGIVLDHTTNQKIIVVVGGLGTGGSAGYELDSTEMLENDQWKPGM